MKGFICSIFICCMIELILSLPLRESWNDNIEHRGTGFVKYYLYTKSNPTDPQELFINNIDSVRKSNFDKSRQTKIIIHGWGNTYLTTPNRPIREAYFEQDQDFNIISIDWSEYAKLNYVSSRAKVPLVGEDLAEFLDFLHEKFSLNFDMVVVIGHSLGAHVAGYCGKNVKSGKLAGIVGLDPAYPLYSFENTSTRLSDTDAKYVESIQTNGNVKGFLKPIGQASFYPNWGRLQPGCGVDLDGTCSHARCVTLYAEALRGYSYAPIYKCDHFDDISNKIGCKTLDTNISIGDPLQIKRTPGIFYFTTSDSAPYGHITLRFI